MASSVVVERQGEITDAQLLDLVERVQDAGPDGVGQQGQQRSKPPGVVGGQPACSCVGDPFRVDRMVVGLGGD